MTALRRFAVAFVVLSSLLAFAPAHAKTTDTWYVKAADLPPALLPPPPAENSPAALKEIDGVLAAQQSISKTDRAAIKDEQHMRLELMTDVMGKAFTRERFPETFILLDHVFSDTRLITDADKQFWHTRRPYLVDHRVKLLVEPLSDSPAYPSGHTCGTRVVAEVLGMLYPDHLVALRARADNIARHRIEAGVHDPVDIEGGRMLAMLITGALTQNRDFQSDLETARLETTAMSGGSR